MIYSYSDYVKDPFRAVGDIATLLYSSSLMLFLGSGVSSGFGLPQWALMAARLLGRDKDTSFVDELSLKDDKQIAKLIDPIDDESEKYVTKVYDALYCEIAANLSDQLSRSPLLLAVAGLLTGSCRGRISSVMTYNYDDLLKQYLGMLGYTVCIRTDPTQFSTWADVEINHIHGYLPQSRKGESKGVDLVLSEKSYRRRRAFIDEGWSSYVEHGLYSKSGLFLGLSGDDSAILDVMKRAQEKIKRTEDYTGYWLMTPTAFERNAGAILDVGMCPIKLTKDDFPRFVFAVCQEAASG
jgi:hypothetical protein